MGREIDRNCTDSFRCTLRYPGCAPDRRTRRGPSWHCQERGPLRRQASEATAVVRVTTTCRTWCTPETRRSRLDVPCAARIVARATSRLRATSVSRASGYIWNMAGDSLLLSDTNHKAQLP